MGSDVLSTLHPIEFQQLDRVVDSSVVHGSETLRRLLRYLVEQHFEHPGDLMKEHQIARELLGKGADFDSRIDPTVRVQVGRLRSKLVEYYATEGAADDVIIEIPKGSYDVVFRRRNPPEPVGRPVPQQMVPPPAAPIVAPIPFWRRRYLAGPALILTFAVLAVLARMVPQRRTTTDTSPGESLRIFWQAFADSANPPLVVFSNGPFVGNPVSGMRYYNPALDSDSAIFDHYTGVGEVFAIHDLDTTFFALGRHILIKRARLLTWDETKRRGVIFVGSPSEDLNLKDVPYEREFIFRTVDSPDHVQSIVNLHPRAGESAAYLATGTNVVLEDYSLITLIPGFGDTHPILLLAGTTTFGTHGAAEFVCRERSVSGLLDHFRDRRPVPFSAIIRVKVTGGVPVSSELVTLHTMKPRDTN